MESPLQTIERLQQQVRDLEVQLAAAQQAVPDEFGTAAHWKEKAQYWAGVAHRLRSEALRGEHVDGIVQPAPQSVQDGVPAMNHSETPNSSTIIVPYGWKLVPDGATPDWVANLEALPDWREAVGECIKRFLAAAPAHPAEGVPAQAVIEALDRMDALLQPGLGLLSVGDNSATANASRADMATIRAALAATQPAAQGLDAGKLLAEKHTGMKVDYRGLLGQVQREIERSAPGHAEMLRQLQGHLQELGQRWYAGDTAVVDELLQLYCVERQARADLAAQAKQGE